MLAPGRAVGSQDFNYGLGGASTGRVGSLTAEVENPFAALINPGVLAAQTTPTLQVSLSGVQARLDRIQNVLLDSPRYRTERGTTRTGNFDPARVSTVLWAAGLGVPFRLGGAGGRKGGVGFVLSGPLDRLRTFRSNTPYDFQNLRYGGADTQFKGTLSAAIEVLRDTLYAGAGVSLFITSAGSAEATLRADNPTARFAADVGLNTSAVGGLYSRLGKNRLSLVYRQEVAPSFVQKFSGMVPLAGEDTFFQPVEFRSTLYFEPHTFETDWQRTEGPITLSVGLALQLWQSYRPSFLLTQTLNSRGEPRSTVQPGLNLGNTLSPRASVEIPVVAGPGTVAVGYAFRPSPVRDMAGTANLLDTDVHAVGLSFSHRIAWRDWPPFVWSVFGQYHHLSRRAVAKGAADSIGSPGYDVAGSAQTYGLSLRAEL